MHQMCKYQFGTCDPCDIFCLGNGLDINIWIKIDPVIFKKLLYYQSGQTPTDSFSLHL